MKERTVPASFLTSSSPHIYKTINYVYTIYSAHDFVNNYIKYLYNYYRCFIKVILSIYFKYDRFYNQYIFIIHLYITIGLKFFSIYFIISAKALVRFLHSRSGYLRQDIPPGIF